MSPNARAPKGAQARLAAIVTSFADAIVGKTLDGIVTSWNEAAERMLGYTAGDNDGAGRRTITLLSLFYILTARPSNVSFNTHSGDSKRQSPERRL
jgi:PAS domain-containing protein